MHDRTGIGRAARVIEWCTNPQVEAGTSEIRCNCERGAESVASGRTAIQRPPVGALEAILGAQDYMDSTCGGHSLREHRQ